MVGIAAVIRLNSERRLNTLLAGQTGARLSERIEGDGSIIFAHVGEMRRQRVHGRVHSDNKAPVHGSSPPE
jgi:hypothetical protein